ncbi:helix-turn-helix transcriptional regulator [Desulfovibrio oxamicus]|uniref:Helix-turn-helix transcriptional regulator n=1 Tax=Nitratidesulfovibrio oxamicus TaxID=32016 RepID=A0ABS0J287_9BACT|nr:S24 family peptidase [Nitratidesulfovibrio oxamicus]MBG3876536.1 helix-turn-helix transcriptional regulator [Nitratidesulfovibrio oxamicus]
MSNIQKRLKELRGQISQARFAQIIGVPQTTLGRYERGDSLPDIAFASHVCLMLDVNPNWLLLGKGPMRQTQRPEGAADRPAPSSAMPEGAGCEFVMVPMVAARLSTENGAFASREGAEGEYAFRTEFLQRRGTPSSMVLMRVDGDGMEPYVLNGDAVLIDQSQRDTRPGKVYAVDVEGMVYLKVSNAVPGKLLLTGYNAACPPLAIDVRDGLADGIRILGRAVWVGRELH